MYRRPSAALVRVPAQKPCNCGCKAKAAAAQVGFVRVEESDYSWLWWVLAAAGGVWVASRWYRGSSFAMARDNDRRRKALIKKTKASLASSARLRKQIEDLDPSRGPL